MPERIANSGEARSQEQQIHRLCTARDSHRYTTERKRQLRFLLGSSSSGSDSSDNSAGRSMGRMVVVAGGRGVTGRGQGEEEESEESALKTDSGIFVATDSDKSSCAGSGAGRGRSLSDGTWTDSHSDVSSHVTKALLVEPT